MVSWFLSDTPAYWTYTMSKIKKHFIFQAFSQNAKNSSPTGQTLETPPLNSHGNSMDSQVFPSTSQETPLNPADNHWEMKGTPSRNRRRRTNGNSTPTHGSFVRSLSPGLGVSKRTSPRNRSCEQKCKECGEVLADKCEYTCTTVHSLTFDLP